MGFALVFPGFSLVFSEFRFGFSHCLASLPFRFSLFSVFVWFFPSLSVVPCWIWLPSGVSSLPLPDFAKCGSVHCDFVASVGRLRSWTCQNEGSGSVWCLRDLYFAILCSRVWRKMAQEGRKQPGFANEAGGDTPNRGVRIPNAAE